MKGLRDVTLRSAANLAGCAAVLLLVISAPGTGAAQTSGAPPELTLTSQGKSVTATQGSYCWRTDDFGLCSDFAYPLEVRCALPVKRGAKLSVDTAIPATSVSARVVNAKGFDGSRLPAWKKGRDNAGGSTIWTFRLTRKAARAAAIDVFGTFPQGDLDTWTGAATPTCRHSEFGRR
jgi:hypothetical protein